MSNLFAVTERENMDAFMFFIRFVKQWSTSTVDAPSVHSAVGSLTHENDAADRCQQHEVLERLAETTPQPQQLDSEGDAPPVRIYHVDQRGMVISEDEWAKVCSSQNGVR
jgi:hypothetical protein